ncbi:MAG: hypothetical protein ACRCZD_10170 [Phycicoccus sp.]
MLNRIADKVLDAVLPHQRAAAVCGPYYYRTCSCVAQQRYIKKCRDCTGAGGGCSGCYAAYTC